MTAVQLLRAARKKTSVRFLLLQSGLAAAAFLLFLLWLRIPDANGAEVLLSALLAVACLLMATGGEAWLLLRVHGTRATRASAVRGAVAILLAIVLLFPLSALLDHISINDSQRAGYLNSQLSANMRHILTYPRLMTLLHQAWASLFWAFAIVLTMVAVAVTVARKPLQALAGMLQSLTAWVVLSLFTIVASEVTLQLLHWTPGHGLGVETTSLLMRIAFTVLLNAWLLCFSLALLIVLAEQSDARYIAAATDEGTPDFSQPRTVGKP